MKSKCRIVVHRAGYDPGGKHDPRPWKTLPFTRQGYALAQRLVERDLRKVRSGSSSQRFYEREHHPPLFDISVQCGGGVRKRSIPLLGCGSANARKQRPAGESCYPHTAHSSWFRPRQQRANVPLAGTSGRRSR